MISVIM